MPFSPRPREIYRVDLSGAVQDLGWNATWRVCVVLDVSIASNRMTVIFGSWDHYPKKCQCIAPKTAKAAPFGAWLEKLTHFSARNVAVVPIDRIVERMGTEMVTVEEWDALDEVASYAELFSMKKAAE
jgi:hypothetical protein